MKIKKGYYFGYHRKSPDTKGYHELIIIESDNPKDNIKHYFHYKTEEEELLVEELRDIKYSLSNNVWEWKHFETKEELILNHPELL